jgi:serine/threonine protein kinase
MDDLHDHVAFTSAKGSGILLGRPKKSHIATKADVVALKAARSKKKTAEAQLLNEVHFLLKLKHPGIVRAHGIYEFKSAGDPCLGLLLDFMKGRDLSRWLPESGLPEEMLRVMMTDICNVLVYLHGMLIVHRDIKLSNVLCERADDSSVRVVLADFGLAAHVEDAGAMSKRCGTPGFTAPEMLKKNWGAGLFGDSRAITKVDVFSFGAMIYTAALGSNPFVGSSREVTLRQNKRGLLPFESAAFRSLSDDLQDLLRSACAIAPSERCSSAEAFLNPWLLGDPDTGFDYSRDQKSNEKLSWDLFEEAATRGGGRSSGDTKC